jgi:diguanylate cyclase (GGDEF)-like protein
MAAFRDRVVLIVHRSTATGDGGVLRVTYANRRARAMFAPAVEGTDAPPLALALPLLARPDFAEQFDRVVHDRHASECEVEFPERGGPRWYRCTAIPLDDGFMLTMFDISEQKVAQDRIARMATVDALTGLPNRAALDQRLERAIAEARRHEVGLGVLFVDVNDFKVVNDSVGHHAGDELLAQIARRLEGAVRRADFVSRPGGDEFVVVVSQTHGTQEIAALARRVLAAFEGPFEVQGRQFQISCSVGIAVLGQHGDDAQSLLRNADTAMYQAKRSGRGCISMFDNDMAVRVMHRRSLESALRGAIGRDELSLHYQPILDCRDNRVVGVEALLRWTHPGLGRVAPAEFIPIAEDTGLIRGCGDWVLDTVARQVGPWRAAAGGEFMIAVNLSPRQMNDELVAKVASVLQSAALDGPWLGLEITESLLMRDLQHSERILRELRGLGVRIAVDDFGTGYSSLSYLKSLPIDTVKIDRSFVRDIRDGTPDARLVAAVVALCKVMNLRVVAEGVETSAELGVVAGLGCDDYQGFVASQPVAAAELEARFLRPR